MAGSGTYRNGARLRDALSDGEGQDDVEDEPLDETVPIPKLRSKIVRAYSDNEEGDGDDGSRQPTRTFSSATGLVELHADSYSRDRQPHIIRLREENWRKGDTDVGRLVDGFRGPFSFSDNDKSKAKWCSVEDLGGRHPSERLHRDRDQHRVKTDRGDRDGRGGTALARDRAAVARLSPQRDHHRERDYGSRRDFNRSAEVEHRRDSFADREFEGLSKGKGKRDSSPSLFGMRGSQGHQRERERESRGSWQRAGKDFIDHNNVAERLHAVDKSSRRDRDDSLSSADATDPGAGSRAFSDFRLEREKGILRDDVRSDRKRSTARLKDSEREDIQGPSVPELYSVHRGTVNSVRAFGIFVRIDGYRNHGLVHLSQVSDHEVTNRNDSDASKVEALSSVAAEGEQVWVKVISVKTEDDGGVKIGCSLKYVSQGDGRDLDPNNLQLEKLQSKPAWQAPKKLELDAVYNVVCTRCGGHGHLKTECYSTGSQSYALLKDEDLEENGARSSKVVAPKSSHAGSSSRAPTGPIGRGRAMVQPAWMKHGVGVGSDQDRATHDQRTMTRIPNHLEKAILGQGSSAAVGKSKEGKRRRRDEKRHRRHGRKEKRHGTKENRRDKHKKRHHPDAEDQSRKRKKR